ncbi:MAG: hypothetical protein K2L23_05320, partial [Odoribacter sp.]|nr:hypothetical protein [Odoribacter sp.]
MKINIIILIIALVSISCKHTTFLEDTFEHVQDVDLIELADFHTDSIGSPIFIYTSKDNVILIEPQMAHLISAYNISNKKYEKFLLKGKGPNESLDIQQ